MTFPLGHQSQPLVGAELRERGFRRGVLGEVARCTEDELATEVSRGADVMERRRERRESGDEPTTYSTSSLLSCAESAVNTFSRSSCCGGAGHEDIDAISSRISALLSRMSLAVSTTSLKSCCQSSVCDTYWGVAQTRILKVYFAFLGIVPELSLLNDAGFAAAALCFCAVVSWPQLES